MSIHKKYLLLYAIVAALMIIKEYGLFSVKSHPALSKPILTLEMDYLQSYLQTYDDNRSLNHYWGFAKEKKIIVTDSHKTKKERNTELRIKQEKDTLCIDNTCYRLLGIHYSKKRAFVTLYNKNLKKRLKDYRVKETLEANISIAAIKSNSVIFTNQNKTKSWIFKLFDVNTTQYKPKDTNETYF